MSKPCGHATRVGGCHWCHLYATHPGYRRLWGGGKGKPAPRVALPCVHVGEELTGRERAARKLGHARKWVYCGHPDKPLGEAVCTCRGCGARCPGYAPGSTRPTPAG